MGTLNIANRTMNGLVIADDLYADATATATGAATWPVGAVLAKVAASGKYVRFDPAGSGGAEIPKAILAAELVFTGSGDKPIRPLISGRVRLGKLVDTAGTALTAVAVDQLRDYTIIAQPVTQLSIQDNQ
jgi:hypothetical protein